MKPLRILKPQENSTSKENRPLEPLKTILNLLYKSDGNQLPLQYITNLFCLNT
ncbi:MAG: hypothetical protein RL329_400 [Bacteroidota bacterium]|jgi:hypothetical protein